MKTEKSAIIQRIEEKKKENTEIDKKIFMEAVKRVFD